MNMKQVKVINVAKDYSEEPIGRFPTDSDFNGQKFREEYLLPALRKFDKVIVELDGAEGYGSSFLDEAFGGLVRVDKLSKQDILNRLELVSEEDESLITEILGYI
jgi:hypothetical protein